MQKVLIISSCTKKKNLRGLREDRKPKTIDDLQKLCNDSLFVKKYSSLASELYLGKGHKYVKEAIEIFKSKKIKIDWQILSAGYGLISNDKVCIPYDITFMGQKPYEIINNSNKLHISKNVDKAIKNHDVVFFALTPKYLQAIQFNKLKNLYLNKTLIFIESKSSLKSNKKIYEMLMNKINIKKWSVSNWKKHGSNRYFRSYIIKEDIANKTENNQSLIKFINDIKFN